MDANIQDINSSIVKIHCQAMSIDPFNPSKPDGGGEGVGTGFFVTDRHILTCYHVVSDAVKLYVSFPQHSKEKYPVTTLGMLSKFDMAIVEFNHIVPFKYNPVILGDSDNLRMAQNVLAVGFPLGEDNIKYTGGKISGFKNNFIQTDTPINPGNSGGPLVIEGSNQVIGVNTEKLVSWMADNIGYANPISIFTKVWKDNMLNVTEPTFIRQPELYIQIADTDMDTIKYYDIRDDSKSHVTGGVIITEISPFSWLRDKIREGDILYRIDHTDLNNQTRRYDFDCFGETRVDWSVDRTKLPTFLNRFPYGHVLTLFVYCNPDDFHDPEDITEPKDPPLGWKANTTISIPIKLEKNKELAIKKMHYPLDQYSYYIFGAMVFVNLTFEHLFRNTSNDLVTTHLHEYTKTKNRDKQRVILGHIYSGSLISKYELLEPGSIIKSVNGVKLTRVEQFIQLIKNPIMKNGTEYLHILTETNQLVVVPMDKLRQDDIEMTIVHEYKVGLDRHSIQRLGIESTNTESKQTESNEITVISYTDVKQISRQLNLRSERAERLTLGK